MTLVGRLPKLFLTFKLTGIPMAERVVCQAGGAGRNSEILARNGFEDWG